MSRSRLFPSSPRPRHGPAARRCRDEPSEITLEDLEPHERTYVERFILLERARAVTFTDLERGEAILDSLAAAWNDTLDAGLDQVLGTRPQRLAAVHGLLERLLAAEEDSLLYMSGTDRLDAPLPDLESVPAPPEP